MKRLWEKRVVTALVVLALISLTTMYALGLPSGASISNNVTTNGPSSTIGSHTANRSTITTMILDSTQQDQNWKGYVGNVTGSLTLDNAASQTIYDWPLTSYSGEVYAARSGSVGFGGVQCAQTSNVNTENTFFNMTSGQVDSINWTFNSTAHAPLQVGGSTLNNCPTTAMFVSDARQAQAASADFQEVLIEDASNRLIFATIINDDTTGFDGDLYDFQMIVPESDVNSTVTTYYFFMELSG